MRDLALLKAGTLDLLSPALSLQAALSFLPPGSPAAPVRLRAYLAHTCLHDLYWLLRNDPYDFDAQRALKLPRTRQALAALPPA
ncbi:hypothetical protein ACFP81_02755 [Deinococcus lacus]|uniref:Uncharacterized protein n=1 Tax=Deinococcus lacus TaxID=392561 RepID=A0ABW1Y9T8_9DEIO